MNIGCITMARFAGKIIGINCAKGRGIIMPGGKWNPGETFVDCARREFKEETGLDAFNVKLLFAGVSEEGFFTYAFGAYVQDYKPLDSDEGKVVLTNWDELKRSKFGGYYQLLQLACGEWACVP